MGRPSRASAIALAALIVAGALAVASTAQGTSERNFATHLTGAEEVPARATPAHGQAHLQLSRDGSELVCKLNVSEISNVVQAHIHLGQPTDNGPIVAFLYGPVAAGGGPVEGRLSTTTVTAADLRGPLTGSENLEALMEQVRAGKAYVNVHTNDGVAPINTGPGDFPGGEIRGNLN